MVHNKGFGHCQWKRMSWDKTMTCKSTKVVNFGANREHKAKTNSLKRVSRDKRLKIRLKHSTSIKRNASSTSIKRACRRTNHH